jgi:hypothetical protein
MTEPTPDGTLATAVESLARRLDYAEPVKPTTRSTSTASTSCASTAKTRTSRG